VLGKSYQARFRFWPFLFIHLKKSLILNKLQIRQEAGSRKQEAGGRKQEAGSRKLEAGRWRLEAGNS